MFDGEAVGDEEAKESQVGFWAPAFKVAAENPGAEAHPQALVVPCVRSSDQLAQLLDRNILAGSEYIRFKIAFVFLTEWLISPTKDRAANHRYASSA